MQAAGVLIHPTYERAKDRLPTTTHTARGDERVAACKCQPVLLLRANPITYPGCP
jgi:hypothetical protein